MAKEEKEFSFSDLNKAMSKVSAYGDTMDNSDISTIDEYLNTGNYMLNAALVGDIFKGYPNNRSTALVGPSGCLQKNEHVRIYKIKHESNKTDRSVHKL